STFSSYVRFRCLSVARKVPSELGERLGQISVGVKFESCTFKNGLALWRPEARDVHDQSKPTRVVTAFSDADLESRTRIKGSLRIVDCRVTGDLDLTGVQMEDAE